jgi:alpha-glucosidase
MSRWSNRMNGTKPGLFTAMAAVLLGAALAGAAGAKEYRVQSPDGNLAVTVRTEPSLSLSVALRGATVIPPSPLGITLEKSGRFPEGFRCLGEHRAVVDETYDIPVGKRLRCRNHANELTLDFTHDQEARISLIVRAYDEGVAYRYRVDGEGPDTAAAEEPSGFRLPPDSAAWVAPYTPYYEELYERRENWTGMEGAVQVPALFRTPDGAWVLITEAAVDGTYAGSRLTVRDAATGLLGFRADGASTSGRPWLTPWRVAMVGSSLKPLVESTLINNLNPPSRIADTSWIQPGAGLFPWLTNANHNNQDPARMKQFVDQAAEMGLRWIEFDNALALGNQQADPPEKWMAVPWIAEVAVYANSKGISVYGWDHIRHLDTPEKRAHILDWLAAKGFKGIKVDFLNSDSQAMYRFREEVARDCADRKLMLSYHGDVTPRGMQRTWPNIATHEGVRGEEYYPFTDKGPSPAHNVNLVFTRNIPGSMDYTPTTFDLAGFPPGNRKTTSAHEIALAVVFESGWQVLGLNPESVRGPAAPGVDFLRHLPSAWDETLFLGGAPDEYAVLARRQGDAWWIAGINAGASRPITLDLGFLPGPVPAELYTDDPQQGPDTPPLETKVVRREITLDPARPLEIVLPANGGFGIRRLVMPATTTAAGHP